MSELTRLQGLQIICSSAAQGYIEVLDWYSRLPHRSVYDVKRMGDATNNLREATRAVDAQMAYEREKGEIK